MKTRIYATPAVKGLNKYILIHLKFYLATATHNLNWVKIAHICFIWDH